MKELNQPVRHRKRAMKLERLRARLSFINEQIELGRELVKMRSIAVTGRAANNTAIGPLQPLQIPY